MPPFLDVLRAVGIAVPVVSGTTRAVSPGETPINPRIDRPRPSAASTRRWAGFPRERPRTGSTDAAISMTMRNAIVLAVGIPPAAPGA